MTWQPIEKAPRELAVQIILPDYRGNPTLTIGALVDGGDGYYWHLISIAPNQWHYDKTLEWHDFEADDDYQPTHWMPLPTPPNTQQNSEEER